MNDASVADFAWRRVLMARAVLIGARPKIRSRRRKKGIRPSRDIPGELEQLRNVISAPKWRQWECCRPAPAAARWARFIMAMKTKMPSPIQRARHFGFLN